MNDYARRKMYDRLFDRANHDVNDYPDAMKETRYPYRDDHYDFSRNDRRKRRDYHYREMENEYDYDIDDGIKKLKRYDKFKYEENQILEKAKQMGVRFDNVDEREFIFMFYYIQSEFKNLFSDVSQYINMTKASLEQEGISATPSEKVSIILEEIVLGR